MKNITNKLKAWYQASRPPFYIATIIPLCMSLAMSSPITSDKLTMFLWINLAAFMVHLATNLANDLFDHYQGTDADESIGGSRVLQEGKLSIKSIWIAVISLYTFAGFIAIYITWSQNIWMLWSFILFAFFSSIFYVAPPIKYGYRGLGELFVGINMGPIMVVGSYWAITGNPSWDVLWASIPIGLMVATILFFQNLPDIETDKKVGKNTLAVILGRERSHTGIALFGISIYLSIILLIILNIYPIWSFLVVAAVPLLLKILKTIKETENWIDLNERGDLIRKFYFINGAIIIIGLFIA